jgi:hypothetical protein
VLSQLTDARRVLLCGDWHGNSQFARKSFAYARKHDCDVIIQLGDFGIWPGLAGEIFREDISAYAGTIPLFFIDGNHEDFSWLNAQPLDADGLRPLARGLTHIPRGFRWTDIAGETWLALGGATSLDRPQRTQGVSWWSEEEITLEQSYAAVAGGHADIMLTHDCPTGTDIPGIYHRQYVPYWDRIELERAWNHRDNLRRIVEEIRPSTLYHGHFHTRYSGKLVADYDCTVIGLADDSSGSVPEASVVVDIVLQN